MRFSFLISSILCDYCWMQIDVCVCFFFLVWTKKQFYEFQAVKASAPDQIVKEFMKEWLKQMNGHF